jgi:hypothetical protein
MRMQKRTDALMFSPRFLGFAPALLLSLVAASAHAGSSAPRDADDSRISVTAVAGDVDFTMAGRAVAVAPRAPVLLPARIVTGQDGNVGLTQAGTNINVANDTDVEIPAEAVDGNLIARLVQHRGNVFYDVAPRDVGKLRVETPFLVAVIKGTQFNVAVQQDSTTISLFEGRLEIRTPDNTDIVQLNAGEIAIRSRADGAIRVVGMNDERVAAPAAARPAVADAARETLDTNEVAIADDGVVLRSSLADSTVVASPTVDVAGDRGALDVALDANVASADGRVDVELDTDVDLGAGALDVGLDTGVDLAGVTADVGLDTALDVGGGTLDLGLDTALDVDTGILDAGVDAGLDLDGSLDAGLDTGLELDGLVDTSADAGVTLDDGSLDVDLDAGLDLGVLDVELDVDLGAGTLDLGLDGGDSAPAAPRLGELPGGLL